MALLSKEDGAGTTNAYPATIFGSGEAKLVPEYPQQGECWVDGNLRLLTI
jgi:hypothetical protein